MPVPHPTDVTLPLLQCLARARARSRAEWEAAVVEGLRVSARERATRRFGTSCSWAWIHLRYARLVEGRAAGPTWITERGRLLLAEGPASIDASVLNRYEEYRRVKQRWKVPVHLRPTDDPKVLEKRVAKILASGTTAIPPGVEKPRKIATAGVRFERDPAVVAAVLRLANGKCEACNAAAPFARPDGLGYLEVHHVRTLALGGADRVNNAVAVCPNCHRALHFSSDARERSEVLRRSIDRLTPAKSP